MTQLDAPHDCRYARVMRHLLFCLLTLAAGTTSAQTKIDPATATPDEKGVLFYDIRPLGVEGQGWTDTRSPFDRLPAKAEKLVRPAVWNLSRQSAGLCVRFVTDATTIQARWALTSTSKLDLPTMPATGVSGLDLYVKTPEGKWHWLAVGRPATQPSATRPTTAPAASALTGGLAPGTREYLLYLPLYNGVKSVEIGLPKSASLFKADPRPADRQRPIVFYGTSITQGAAASRPGMCHPAILGRRLDRPVINLGFSGNGKMEPEVATLLAELDPAVFVIDCLPNMEAPLVAQNAEPLVRTLRKAHPTTPILLVEDRTYADTFLIPSRQKRHSESRATFRKVYDKLAAEGDTRLAYLPGEQLLALDGDDTVDSSHPSDLGFVHQSDAFEPILRKLLGQ